MKTMKSNIFGCLPIVIMLLSAAVSCSKQPYLTIPEFQQSYEFDAAGGTRYASIECNQAFDAKSDCEWCYVETYDHRNNNLRITVYGNDVAENRTAVIVLSSDDLPEQSITVRQAAASPYIASLTKSVVLDADTPDFTVSVKANTMYEIVLPSWIAGSEGNVPAIGEAVFSFTAESMPASMSERTGDIVFVSTADASLSVSVPVTQTHEVLPVLDEHFDFATGTASNPGSTTGEVQWAKLENNNGWNSELVNGNINVWAREGCLRFSRTGYGGILVSPKLSAISGTADVVVTFKAARWKGSDTYHTFLILVRNAGTASQSLFEINNVDADVWQDNPASVYSFEIAGATSETQIVFISADNEDAFIGADKKGVGRLLLDDVKVEYK